MNFILRRENHLPEKQKTMPEFSDTLWGSVTFSIHPI